MSPAMTKRIAIYRNRDRFTRIARKLWNKACLADGIPEGESPVKLFSPAVGAKYDKRVMRVALAADRIAARLKAQA